MEPSLQLVTIGARLPRWLHRFAVWVVDNIVGDTVFGSIFGESCTMRADPALSRSKSVGEMWDLTYRRDEYTKRFRQAVSRSLAELIIGMGREQARLYHLSCPSRSGFGAWPDQAAFSLIVSAPSSQLKQNRHDTLQRGRLHRRLSTRYSSRPLAGRPPACRAVSRGQLRLVHLGEENVRRNGSSV